MPLLSSIHPDPAPDCVKERLNMSMTTCSVVIATTEGKAFSTTSAMFGKTGALMIGLGDFQSGSRGETWPVEIGSCLGVETGEVENSK
jgi:hypothetical protein